VHSHTAPTVRPSRRRARRESCIRRHRDYHRGISNSRSVWSKAAPTDKHGEDLTTTANKVQSWLLTARKIRRSRPISRFN